MKLLSGQASSIRSTTSVSGGGRDSAVTTTHILLLKVNGVQAEIQADSPPIIDEGEFVVLAGDDRNGAFEALAYKNESTGVVGNAGLTGSLIGSAVGIGGGILVLVNFSSPSFGLVPKLVALAFFAVGAFSIRVALRISAAVSLLSKR